MPSDIKFEELGLPERILLLRAFDYDVDNEGYIINQSGSRISSLEVPYKHLRAEDVMLAPSTLEVLDGTPTSISKYIREKVEQSASS
jgi:hypothetical protein